MISAVMITCDRSPGKNYVNETLQGIYERGTLDSTILERFAILESTPPNDLSHLTTINRGFPIAYPALTGSVLSEINYSILLHRKVFSYASHRTLQPFEACAEALRIGYCDGCDWLLFMEDDIEISSDFFESVSTWLAHYGDTDKPYLYSFGSVFGNAFRPTDPFVSCGFLGPLGFFGTQCFAVRSIDALALSSHLIDIGHYGDFKPGEYDLMIAGWLSLKQTWVRYSIPSFVQHIGKDSKINPRDNVHTFPSYPGKDWSYLKAVNERK